VTIELHAAPPPLLITTALARRIEASSQLERVAYIAMHRRIYPSKIAETREIGGALAVVSGSHVKDEAIGHRAFSRCIGLGFEHPVTELMVEEVERFYAEHGVPTRIDLCPFAAPELRDLLRARGYTVESFLNTWIRSTAPVSFRPNAAISVSLASPAEREEWRDTLGRGFASDDTIPIDPIADTVSHLPEKLLFLARIEGEAAGAAAAHVRDSIALVNGAATRPGFRGRGVQQALLAARINHVAGACELMTVITSPGSDSERNVQRFGFRLLHTKAIMIR
jgi:GNAT superfamily N-acetyltransferase